MIATAGDVITQTLRMESTGEKVPLYALAAVSVGAMFYVDPPPAGGSAALSPGVDSYPVSYTINPDDTITMRITGDYPFTFTFVHPINGFTTNLSVSVIPPHDHRNIARGGPAVGSFDAFLT